MRTALRVFVTLSLVVTACEDPPAPGPVVPKTTPSSSVSTPMPAVVRTTKRVAIGWGKPIGSEVVTTAPDGSISVALDIHDNGRGPHTDAKLRLAADGTIASYEATGHHTLGTPIAESFSIEGGRARWKSPEEQGEKTNAGGAFFVPGADLACSIGFLAEALLKRNGAISLLPAGEARMEKTGDATVTSKGGPSRHIVGYAITGLELTPTRVWMNDDGSWFGVVSPWFSVVPDGFEDVIDGLVAKQTELDSARDAKLAKTLGQKPPAAGRAFTHARVLDVEKGKWMNDATIVVVGDSITAVGNGAKIPTGAEVVDLGNKAVLPGLWDMHAHLGEGDGVLDIGCGVTTARDVGNDPDKLDDYKKRFDDGSAIGPHVLRYGFIEGRGKDAASSKVTAENEAEAKAAVELFAKRGYEGIKIYNSMKPELVPLLAKDAHARGMGVTGHIPVHMLANEAVRAGYDGIEHINMLFLNFIADHDTDTRTPLRFTLVGEKAGSLDLASKPVKDFVALLRDRKIVVDPTLGVFEDLLLSKPGHPLHGLESIVARLPVQAQRNFLRGSLPLGDKEEVYYHSFEKLLEMVKLLHDEKVPVVAGTDWLAGLAVDHELALFVRAGISTADAIRMATIDPARFMKRDNKTGSIAVGKTADFFVVDGDPLAHIEDVAKVTTTVRGGISFAAAPVLDSAGVKPGH